MNGKFILIVMICMNMFAFFISAGYSELGSESTVGSFYLVEMFTGALSLQEASDMSNENTGVFVSSNVSNALDGLTTEQSGGSFLGEILPSGFQTFLDGLKMIMGLISLLTPLPILAFLSSLSLPLWILWAVGIPVFILYLIALAEFVGNRTF